MKNLRFLVMALALVAFAGSSYAQFNCGFSNYTFPLTHGCGAGGFMGPECLGKVYWDANNNGPDIADQLPTVGNGFGQCNFNTFPINGGEYLGQDGLFVLLETFTIPTNTPAPSRYYVVVECGISKWTSEVFTIPDGYSEPDLDQWACQITQEPCNEPTEINIETVGGRDFLPEGAVYTNCFDVCEGTTVTICLGPLAADEMPVSAFGEDCLGTPATFTVDPNGWQYNATNGTWCLSIAPSTDGCVCFRLDDILAAEHGSFDAVAHDNSVELSWNTVSETEVESFSVLRKVAGHEAFDLIARVAATNSAAGATYTYVDNDAVNGTTYEYTLSTVNVDGSVESWGLVVTATPSSDAALITEYALHQNYPNPFNPSTNLVYDVVADNNVTLTVYNAMGQEVATLVNVLQSAGRHTVSFDAANLTSGLYFYTVKIGNEFTATKKMLLVK